MIPVAVPDACVLYPPSLRDLLMQAAVAGVYAPRWTEEIHIEWTRNVLVNTPKVTPAQFDRTHRLMNQAVPNCLVSDYQSYIPTLNLPDANDRHVLAAAIKTQAPLIITFNLTDFPNAVLRTYEVQAVHPDPFLEGFFDEQPELFLRAVRAHRSSLHHPPKDAAGYLQMLRTNGLQKLALRLEAVQDQI